MVSTSAASCAYLYNTDTLLMLAEACRALFHLGLREKSTQSLLPIPRASLPTRRASLLPTARVPRTAIRVGFNRRPGSKRGRPAAPTRRARFLPTTRMPTATTGERSQWCSSPDRGRPRLLLLLFRRTVYGEGNIDTSTQMGLGLRGEQIKIDILGELLLSELVAQAVIEGEGT